MAEGAIERRAMIPRREEIELLQMLTHTSNQLNHALDLLLRIKDAYPHIFSECIIKEDMEKLMESYKKHVE